MPPRRYYTYTELAEQIEVVLGVRPSLSTLRAAAAATGRGTNSRVRITACMPLPRPGLSDDGHAVFAAGAVDRWLAHHPRRRVAREQERLGRAAVSRRDVAVVRAREAGLSWQQIADAVAAADGRAYSRQWAQQRWGH